MSAKRKKRGRLLGDFIAPNPYQHEDQLNLKHTYHTLGISKSRFAERMLRSRLLICPPVLWATSSHCPPSAPRRHSPTARWYSGLTGSCLISKSSRACTLRSEGSAQPCICLRQGLTTRLKVTSPLTGFPGSPNTSIGGRLQRCIDARISSSTYHSSNDPRKISLVTLHPRLTCTPTRLVERLQRSGASRAS